MNKTNILKTVTTNHDLAQTVKALNHGKDLAMDKVMYRLKQKGPGLFIDRHQIYGVIAEEVNELLDAIHNNDLENMEEELIDVVVAALWGLASLVELTKDTKEAVI